MNELRELVQTHREWLTERVIAYAKSQGYAANAPLLPYPWEASVCGLGEPLARAFEAPEVALQVRQGTAYGEHPLTAFGMAAATAHRGRGVALADFLGLLKYYRRAHVDLLEHAGLDLEARARLRTYVDGFFDLIEIGVVTEWAALDREARLAELQETNRRLAADKARYLTVFESLANPALIVDAMGTIDTVNWAAARTFGAVGQTPGSSHYQGAVPAPLLAQTQRLLAAAEQGRELVLETASGPRHFTVTARRLFDVTDQIGGQVLLLHDVSDYVALREEAALVNRAKSVFLATMSHEVRTPLNGILGAVELLRVAPGGHGGEAALQAIQASAQVLLSLVDDVLDHARLEAAEVEIRAEPVRLADIARRAAALVGPRATAKGLRLATTIAPEAEIPVLSDPAKLQRIVVNLLDNAVKFTLAGTIEVLLEARPTPDGRLLATLEVADTGIGIAPDRLNHLFEPFTQADPTIQGTFGGTGLGLAICRRLAQLLGGRIEAKSTPGKGSMFALVLERPIAGSDGAPRRATERRARLPLQVLLVEDNDVNRVITAGLLRHAGYEVLTAATAAMALATAREQALDAVVLDLRLPDADGLVLAGELRASRTAARGHLPIVVLTATADAELEAACRNAGVDAFLTKPSGLHTLDAVLQEITTAEPPAAPTGAGVVEVVDRRRLEGHLTVLGGATLRTIVDNFRSTARKAERLLQRVRTTADLPPVVDALHGLRGAASQLGLVGIARGCGRLEHAASQGQLAALEAERAAFVLALGRAQASLQAAVEELIAAGGQPLRKT